MAKVAGSLWVESSDLHFVAEDGSEWRYVGESTIFGSSALIGSLWIEGDYLYYVDVAQTERRVPNVFIKTTTGL